MTTTITYCSVEDVRRVLQSSTIITNDQYPTDEDVRKFITAAESRINKITRHAWKAVTVTDEYYDMPTYHVQDAYGFLPIFLNHRSIRPLTTPTHKVEIWDGTTWVDWLVVANGKTQSRASDFWLNETDGTLYIKRSSVARSIDLRDVVRVTYAYGDVAIPEDIRDACAYLAASRLVMDDDKIQMLNETNSGFQMNVDAKSKRWEDAALKTLADYQEMYSV